MTLTQIRCPGKVKFISVIAYTPVTFTLTNSVHTATANIIFGSLKPQEFMLGLC